MKFASIGILVVMAACGGGDDGGDDDAAVDELTQCLEVRSQWRAMVASVTDNQCDFAADCVVIGETSGCGCIATLAESCSGAAMSDVGFDTINNDLEHLETRWDNLGCANLGDERICDCTAGTTACVDHVCVVESTSVCFGVDAGVQ